MAEHETTFSQILQQLFMIEVRHMILEELNITGFTMYDSRSLENFSHEPE